MVAITPALYLQCLQVDLILTGINDKKKYGWGGVGPLRRRSYTIIKTDQLPGKTSCTVCKCSSVSYIPVTGTLWLKSVLSVQLVGSPLI